MRMVGGYTYFFLYLSKNSKKKWNFGDFHKYTVCFWRLNSFNSQHVLNVRAIFDFVHNIDLERDLVMFCVSNGFDMSALKCAYGRKYLILKKTSFVVFYGTTWTPKTMVIVANSIGMWASKNATNDNMSVTEIFLLSTYWKRK